jgi:hypothetical protein
MIYLLISYKALYHLISYNALQCFVFSLNHRLWLIWHRGPGVSSLAYNRRFFAIPGLLSDHRLLVLQIESVVQAIYNLLTSEAFLVTLGFCHSMIMGRVAMTGHPGDHPSRHPTSMYVIDLITWDPSMTTSSIHYQQAIPAWQQAAGSLRTA